MPVWFTLWIEFLGAAMMFAQMAPPKSQAPQVSVPHFEDIAQKAGLIVPHKASPDKQYIVESMSGGVGLIDCDNDGKLDIIVVNGSTIEHFRSGGGDPLITFYHQDAGFKFTDITQSAGLTRIGWGMAESVSDYDN